MQAMRDAAEFFDNHMRNLKEQTKQQKFISRKAEQLAKQAKARLDRSQSGRPLNERSAAPTTNSSVQRNTLVNIMQSVHQSRDDASKQLHARVLQALKEPEVKSSALAEIKALVNELNKVSSDEEKQKRAEEWKLGDSNVWGELADQFDGNKKEMPKLQSTKDVLTSGLASFLGPAGVLVDLGKSVVKEYKDDALSVFDKVKRLVGIESKTNTERKNTNAKNGRIWSARINKLGYNIKSALRKAGSKIKSAASWSLSKVASILKFLGRNRGTAAKALGIGAGILGTAGLIGAGGAAAMLPFAENESVEGQPVPIASTGTQQKSKSDKWSLKTLSAYMAPVISKVTRPFSELSDWLGDKWKSFLGLVHTGTQSVTDLIDGGVLRVKMLKDDAEEVRDHVWDFAADSFNSLWNKVKQFVPEPIRNALSKGKHLITSLSTKFSDDGTSKPESISMIHADPGQGQKAVVLGNGVDMAGLNPSVRNNLYAMAAEYYAKTGKKIKVNSAKRSSQEQAALYQSNPEKAAKPGYSMHEYGYAFDVTDADGTATQLDRLGLLQKYGFMRPLVNASFPEPWHIEPIAIQGAKSAIRRGLARIDDQPSGARTPDSKVESEGASTTKSSTQSTSTVQQIPSRATGNTTQRIGTPSNVSSDIRTASNMSSAGSVSTVPYGKRSIGQTSVAPATESFARVASTSDVIDADVPWSMPVPKTAGRKADVAKTTVGSVPLYLGDMDMLIYNFGMTGN